MQISQILNSSSKITLQRVIVRETINTVRNVEKNPRRKGF